MSKCLPMLRCAILLTGFLAGFGPTNSVAANRFGLLPEPDTSFPAFPARPLRYHPDGQGFSIRQGRLRFNRALYGTHSAFRVEAGDLPEFALYVPGMGGTLKLALVLGNRAKWLEKAAVRSSRYQGGSMSYRIADSLLAAARLELRVLALEDREGMILRIRLRGAAPGALQLLFAFGGLSALRFARNGDLGADLRSGFDLLASHARGNRLRFSAGHFSLRSAPGSHPLEVLGRCSKGFQLRSADAGSLSDPETLLHSGPAQRAPVVLGLANLRSGRELYVLLQDADTPALPSTSRLADVFVRSDRIRSGLVSRLRIRTPDPYLNPLGPTLVAAADGIWQSPAYLHGAIAWRMWLNGWRGVYTADALGWHGRARTEFSAYNRQQLLWPDSLVLAPDPKAHDARQMETRGKGIYNNGYITRYPKGKLVMNHYDMNLVYFDALLRHFRWVKDSRLMRSSFPALLRDLDWEQRNFDTDRDSLYDAYAAIWASDALEYSGGDVTYSSAYNCYAWRETARLAQAMGKDPVPYLIMARGIRKAINRVLWMPRTGSYAEYRDRMGLRLLHPDAALWTLYHSIDSRICDPFQAYQATRYIDTRIPHIPLRILGQGSSGYLLSTSDWMPYTWSLNNVVLAEMVHTSLAFWQAGRYLSANRLFKSLVLESMYMGSSPGNFEQLSYYDRYRGELYRDFADPIGIFSRALVEGLFGILPDQLSGTLRVRPGFPPGWTEASIRHPDLSYCFSRKGLKDRYRFRQYFTDSLRLELQVPARRSGLLVTSGSDTLSWSLDSGCVAQPLLDIHGTRHRNQTLVLRWSGSTLKAPPRILTGTQGQSWQWQTEGSRVMALSDPQHCLASSSLRDGGLRVRFGSSPGWHTFFVRVQQSTMRWWVPVNVHLQAPLVLEASRVDPRGNLLVRFSRQGSGRDRMTLRLKGQPHRWDTALRFRPGTTARWLRIPREVLVPGSNHLLYCEGSRCRDTAIQDWSPKLKESYAAKMVPLSGSVNGRLDSLFLERYLYPRPQAPTLQLPWQGIGNWCYPLVQPRIEDSGLQRLCGKKGYFRLPQGIPLQAASSRQGRNVAWVSRWSNDPDTLRIPLSGRAWHAYVLLAGTTNAMQTHLCNGLLRVVYRDGSSDSLQLRNPQNWWPIEQDCVTDGYAFRDPAPHPYRLYLASGIVSSKGLPQYRPIPGFSPWGIPGGAATVLDLPLDPSKTLDCLEFSARTNDVVLGLISLTLMPADRKLKGSFYSPQTAGR